MARGHGNPVGLAVGQLHFRLWAKVSLDGLPPGPALLSSDTYFLSLGSFSNLNSNVRSLLFSSHLCGVIMTQSWALKSRFPWSNGVANWTKLDVKRKEDRRVFCVEWQVFQLFWKMAYSRGERGKPCSAVEGLQWKTGLGNSSVLLLEKTGVYRL